MIRDFQDLIRATFYGLHVHCTYAQLYDIFPITTSRFTRSFRTLHKFGRHGFSLDDSHFFSYHCFRETPSWRSPAWIHGVSQGQQKIKSYLTVIISGLGKSEHLVEEVSRMGDAST